MNKKRQPAFMQNPALKGLEVGECGFITAETLVKHGLQASLWMNYLMLVLAVMPFFENALLFCVVYIFWWLLLIFIGYFRNSRKPLSQNFLELREFTQCRFTLFIGTQCLAWSSLFFPAEKFIIYIITAALFALIATLCALNDAFIYKRVRFAKFKTEAKS